MPADVNIDGLTLAKWLGQVDHELIRLCDMPSGCLADFPAWDLWADGVSPAEAARVCLLEWNDYPADMLED